VGFRFRKSIKIVPGIRLNLSRSGPSLSLGSKGLHYNIGSKGTRATVGLPGTGLSWSQYSSYSQHETARTETVGVPGVPVIQSQPILSPIVSGSPERINALSTSELAPILDRASRRWRFSTLVLFFCLCVFFLALLSRNERLIAMTALFTTVLVPIAIYLDRYRRSVKMTYKPEGIAAKISEAIAEAFSDLMSCGAVWRVSAQGHTWDWKRNAGATTLTQRSKISLRFARPKCIRGNARFPSIRLGKGELYFLPDALLITHDKSVAALQYKDFTFLVSNTRFIESENVPHDATVVGETWQYVSKKGGPDRRFKFNRRLPVCLYDEVSIQSAGGLNELMHLSKSSSADRFGKIINILRNSTPQEADSRPITSVHAPTAWPSVVFGCFLLLYGSLALALSHLAAISSVDSSSASTPPLETRVPVRDQPAVPRQVPAQQPANKKAIGKPLVITPQ